MPLRGRKGSQHEGGVRGVALVWGVGLEKTGYVNMGLVHVSDWYFSLPTLAAKGLPGSQPTSKADLASLFKDQPEFLPGDGVDVWDAIATDAESPRTEIIHVAQPGSTPVGVLRSGDWKLLVGSFQTGDTQWYQTPGQDFGDNFTVRCGAPPSSFAGTMPLEGDSTFIQGMDVSSGSGCNPSEGPCLFNIAEDPCEHQDRSKDEPDVLANMLGKIAQYQTHTIKLKWQAEPESCLPANLPAPNTGADRPCVGTPPVLPPAPIPAPPAPPPPPAPIAGFERHTASYCGPSKSFYVLSSDDLASCAAKCVADSKCNCFDSRADGASSPCDESRPTTCACRLHESASDITASGAGYDAYARTRDASVNLNLV